MTTLATLFTGFGGVEIGARQAGIELAWGIEKEAAIAEVATANLGHRLTVADVLTVRPREFEAVDILHASPPCVSYSNASTHKQESAADVACGAKVAEFIATLRPRAFTLENVWSYRHSAAYAAIVRALCENGYWLVAEKVDACQHGVPQQRVRLIVRAVRGDFVPYLPPAEPLVGWLSALEDLLPALPFADFAPWQLQNLWQKKLWPHAGPLLVAGGNASNGVVRRAEQPAFTVTASGTKHPIRVWLQGGKVVALTPRARARLQGFPDGYELPQNTRLAVRGIGNAVPPLLFQKVAESLPPHQASEAAWCGT